MKSCCRKSPAPTVVGRKRWCDICKKMIKTACLKKHKLEHHKIGKKPDISCDVCAKIFTRPQALKAHKCRGYVAKALKFTKQLHLM